MGRYGLSHDYLPPNFSDNDQLSLNNLLNDIASSLVFNVSKMRQSGFGAYSSSMQKDISKAEETIEINLERLEGYEDMIKTRSSSIARRMLRIAYFAKVRNVPDDVIKTGVIPDSANWRLVKRLMN